jgi:phosphatidylinositol alpha-1,6-mannosyltransferase
MSNDIKKSLLVTLDFPPNLGGVATFYYNVCKNLPGDKIAVLAPNQEGDDNFDIQQKFPIIRKNLLKQFPKKTSPKSLGGVLKIAASIRWISMIRHFRNVIRKHNIELIQAGQILPIGTLALWCKKRNNIPYIFYAHGMDILLPQKFMRKKTILKKIIKEAKAIVANSYFTKDELIKLGATPEKVKVIYPCPNLDAEQPSELKLEQIKEKYNLNGKKVLLTIGRLVERKGHDMVIKSLPSIIKVVPNLVYLIVGSGPYKEKLEKLVNQYSLRDYVIFTGAARQDDLAGLFQTADVFIMPARRLSNGDVEGFGIVYLEANLFGTPVIGGRSGGVPEAIIDGKTGILVKPESLEEISQAAIKLLTNQPYAERLGMQGMQRVIEEFDWKVQTEKIKELLK